MFHQVVLNATTLGRVLLDATDKNNRNASKIGRKLGSALRALTGTEVLKDWIQEQVRRFHLMLIYICTLTYIFRFTMRFLRPMIPVVNRKLKGEQWTALAKKAFQNYYLINLIFIFNADELITL